MRILRLSSPAGHSCRSLSDGIITSPTAYLVRHARSCYYFAPVEFTEKARIMDSARINRALAGLVSKILKKIQEISDLVVVGFRRRGAPLANRIAKKIADLEGKRPPVGI